MLIRCNSRDSLGAYGKWSDGGGRFAYAGTTRSSRYAPPASSCATPRTMLPSDCISATPPHPSWTGHMSPSLGARRRKHANVSTRGSVHWSSDCISSVNGAEFGLVGRFTCSTSHLSDRQRLMHRLVLPWRSRNVTGLRIESSKNQCRCHHNYVHRPIVRQRYIVIEMMTMT